MIVFTEYKLVRYRSTLRIEFKILLANAKFRLHSLHNTLQVYVSSIKSITNLKVGNNLLSQMR